HDPRLLTRLARTVAKVNRMVIHCWLLQMELLGGFSATMSGIPWLFAERSSTRAYPPTFKNRLRLRAAAFASGIVSNSAGGDLYWRERGTGSVRRYVVSNVVPVAEIGAAPVASSEDLYAGPDEACVLYAGRLDDGKK